eukprot:3913599-Amphidinium_carterae.1
MCGKESCNCFCGAGGLVCISNYSLGCSSCAGRRRLRSWLSGEKAGTVATSTTTFDQAVDGAS